MTPPPRIVYIVGAGLSVGLGFPTIRTLLPKIWNELGDDLARRLSLILRFNHPSFNPRNAKSYPNIEEVLSEMQANEELFASTRAATGRFTPAELRATRQALLFKIVDWFHTLQRKALAKNPKWLHALVERMKEENAQIVSFNWDLVLDELLFGTKLNPESYGFGGSGSVRLIKPHGSLNWFQGATAAPLKGSKKFLLYGTKAHRVFAFRKFRAPVSKKDRDYMPLIVQPVYAKDFKEPLFQHLWGEVVTALSTASEVRFVGFSLANADFHARFTLRCGFHNQEEGEITGKGIRNPATGRAQVVIVDPNDESQQRIEQCVGWPCERVQKYAEDWVLSLPSTSHDPARTSRGKKKK